MEMHQIRYFITVARTLNFTRAAEQCNVSQPALTRAVQQLEQELGGELVRREGKNTHLTDLGQRMLPLMQQCYESALAAKNLASLLKKGEAKPLSVVLSSNVSIEQFLPALSEMHRRIDGLQLRLMRRHGDEIGDLLQRGSADFSIAGPFEQAWERLDAWPLFEEEFEIVVHREHPFANAETLALGQLAGHCLLVSERCEATRSLGQTLAEHGLTLQSHQLEWPSDVVALLKTRQGIALLPDTLARDAELRRVRVRELEQARKVFLYGVAGRPRSPAGDMFMKLLRARDWSRPGGA
ncbi:MAG: LysR family transcriptional regulator [Hyphomicrobiaceae bacterium]|nr:LysR family transcriptional regulator [Hyphomicrobiaceae bacterium]